MLFPFLLTHNLAVTAEFSSHLKFPFNSQGAHVNSDHLSRSTTRKGASSEAFFPVSVAVANKKCLLWLHKGHGERVLYHTSKLHLTQGWAESTVFKNQALLIASPPRRGPWRFPNVFSGLKEMQ